MNSLVANRLIANRLIANRLIENHLIACRFFNSFYRRFRNNDNTENYIENKKKYSEHRVQMSNEFIQSKNFQYDLEKEETGNYILQNWLSNFPPMNESKSQNKK